MAKPPAHVIAHWSKLIEGLQASPSEFYASVERAIEARKIPGAQCSRVAWREGGPLSAKREYLRVRRHEYVFDLCGAPFGTGFFVSSWLAEFRGCLAWLADLPYAGEFVEFFIKPTTYYRIDTALMFRSAVQAAVFEVLDEMTSTKGLRSLSELERQPTVRDFWERGGLG